PAGFTAATNDYFCDERGMDREDAFDAFVVHNSAYGEGLVDAVALLHDHRAGEDLDALFFAFDDSRVHIDCVTDGKLRDIFLERALLDVLNGCVGHGGSPVGYLSNPNTQT